MARKETSYGIIPIRKHHTNYQVLMIQHIGGHWSFPKGHPEEGEDPLETATRELYEETGLSVLKLIPSSELAERYFFTWEGEKIQKTVIYFVAKVAGELNIDPVEVTSARWVTFEEALELATFSEAKRLCKEVKHLLEHL